MVIDMINPMSIKKLLMVIVITTGLIYLLKPAPKDFTLTSWLVPWDEKRSIQSFKENCKAFQTINLFYYNFDETGTIQNYNRETTKSPEFLELIRKNGIKVFATLVNDLVSKDTKTRILKDPNIIHQILSNPHKRNKHIQEIINLAKEENLAGIDLDYENLYYKDSPLFTAFIKKLSTLLHKNNKLLTITVQPKTSQKNNDGPGAINWQEINLFADKIIIMCYNFSSKKSKPGPISPPFWLEKIIRFAKRNISLNKIILAFPLHGFDWTNETAEQITFQKAKQLENDYQVSPIWHNDKASCSFTYTLNDKKHEVWFEEKRSLSKKLNILRKHGLYAIALWRLGQEDENVYTLF